MRCEQCGQELIRTSERYAWCPRCRGKLIPTAVLNMARANRQDAETVARFEEGLKNLKAVEQRLGKRIVAAPETKKPKRRKKVK
jgi:DNA-directed RNA polymerase subunit RPC12/RpoP